MTGDDYNLKSHPIHIQRLLNHGFEQSQNIISNSFMGNFGMKFFIGAKPH